MLPLTVYSLCLRGWWALDVWQLYINPYKGIFLVDKTSLKITWTSDVDSMNLGKKSVLFVTQKECDPKDMKSVMILYTY